MTAELKKALESAKTKEEKKVALEKFKDELKKLTDEELNQVVGGVRLERNLHEGNFDVCPPGCFPVNNGCACTDDDIW